MCFLVWPLKAPRFGVIQPKASSICPSPKSQACLGEVSEYCVALAVKPAKVSRPPQVASFQQHEVVDAIDVHVAAFGNLAQNSSQIPLNLTLTIQYRQVEPDDGLQVDYGTVSMRKMLVQPLSAQYLAPVLSIVWLMTIFFIHFRADGNRHIYILQHSTVRIQRRQTLRALLPLSHGSYWRSRLPSTMRHKSNA